MANTNETVTVRLVVAADGALRTLDRFDKEMVAAANASVKASSGVDAFTAHVERMRKAQEAGVPVLKARAAAIQQEERVLQNALGRAEPLYKAQIQAERELGRVVAASANLVAHGKMRQEDAIRNIMAVEQAHVAQINKVVAAERRAAEAIQGTAMSVRNSADAVQAANLSYSRNAFESSNIAMQFQDIAVSAQMGMSPMMIALQQGTQLSAVFNQMKNPLQALPAALLSIINPVSLLTIGLVGLTAAAVQWLFQSQESAEETETALERHNKWLDQILAGYEDIQDAAKKVGEEASRLPQSIVELELAIGLKEQQAELDTLNQNIETTRQSIADTANFLRELQSIGAAGGEDTARLGALIDQVQFISDIGLSANSTAEELENATLAARELWNMSDDPSIRDMADQVYKLALQLMGLRARMEETETAADNLNMTDLSGMESFGDITRDLASWHDQLDAAARRAAAGIRESLNAALQAASGYGEAAGAANVYAGSLQRLQALIPAVAAAQEAQNRLAGAQIDFDKGLDALEERRTQGLNRDAYQEQLDALNAAYEAAREQVSGVAALQEEQERLNTNNSLDALTGREQAIGRITQQYEQQEQAIRDLIDTGASQAEVEALLAQNSDNLSQALANTNAQFDAQAEKAAAAGGAADVANEKFKNLAADGLTSVAERSTMVVEGLSRAFHGIGSELFGIIKEGGDIATKALDMVLGKLEQFAMSWLDKIVNTGLDALFSSLFGGFGFGTGTFGVSPITPLGFGGTSGIYPGFANGTNYAPGGMAWVGEQGPELINLPRGSQVFPAAQSRQLAGTTVKNEINIHPPAGFETRTEESEAEGGVRTDVFFDRAVAGAINRPGSQSARAAANIGRVVRR